MTTRSCHLEEVEPQILFQEYQLANQSQQDLP